MRRDVCSMKIDVVKNYNYVPNYKGSFVRDGAFRELEKSLNGTEKDIFETIIKNIENAKDNNQWWFDFSKIRNGSMKLAVIGKATELRAPRGTFWMKQKTL